ncbi:MAG: hypothetical protein ABFS12_06795 [Bacteroidota bacterium]
MHKSYLLIIFFLVSNLILSQNEKPKVSNVEIFIIDSYVTPEEPHKIKITFFTSDSVTSLIQFENGLKFTVSDNRTDEHKFIMSLDSLEADTTVMSYRVVISDQYGKTKGSELYDLYLPAEYELKMKDQSGLMNVCLGGTFFLIPSPVYINSNGNNYFSLTKEFPIISFYGRGYNYPKGYISLEYSYIFKAENRNYLRFGYKRIFQTGFIKYISPGLNFATNFKGFNGISPEVSFGLFEFYDAFTFYLRYRYNFKPGSSFEDFHEVSIGLFTSTISFNL